MKKISVTLSIILLIIFTASCSKKDEGGSYQREDSSVDINENVSELQDTLNGNNIEEDDNELEESEFEETELEDTEFDDVEDPIQEPNDSVEDISYIDYLDWESYKTFDLSEIFGVDKFTFDVLSTLSDKTDPLYDITIGIAYTFTSSDTVWTSSGYERSLMRMNIGNPNNSNTPVDLYNGNEEEILDRYDNSVKVGMGSTMYDAQFSNKGNHKMLSFKYVGDPVTKCTVTGRIYLANEDDRIPSTNNTDKPYRYKWIEISYTSPQIAESAKNVITDQEIAQFDKFFDHLLNSLVIED